MLLFLTRQIENSKGPSCDCCTPACNKCCKCGFDDDDERYHQVVKANQLDHTAAAAAAGGPAASGASPAGPPSYQAAQAMRVTNRAAQ